MMIAHDGNWELLKMHETLLDLEREALRQAEHLFQTLLERAFTGGL